MTRLNSAFLTLAALAVAALGACDTSGAGSPTGWVCPTDSGLTWDNFGQDFMTSYCTRCHGSFGSQGGVQRSRGSIDLYAADGPNASNHGMPTSSPTPTTEERQLLGEWLSCGAP
ncbi:MAG: hypothetical protein U1F43_02250 [Myxococcota bacterium]